MGESALPKDATGDALRRLETAGSDLAKPMTIDFFIAVPSEEAGRIAGEVAAKCGYEIAVRQDSRSGAWTCYCTKTLVPDYSSVVLAERELDTIGRTVGGYADGFGSFGNIKRHP